MAGPSQTQTSSGITAVFIVGVVMLALAVGAVLVLVLPIHIGLFTSSGNSTPSSNITPVAVTILSGAAENESSPGYSPDVITVVIGVNNTVVWTNDDTATHTVTALNGGPLDSGDITPGGSFPYTFSSPGTYNYTCSYHPWMHGAVIVKASTGVTVEIPQGASTPPSNYQAGGPAVISDSFYNPSNITIVIGVNNTVTWVNKDSVAHTVTSASGNTFNSGNLNPGATYTFTFTTPGVYKYYCTYHPWMGGEVIVLPAPSPTTQGGG